MIALKHITDPRAFVEGLNAEQKAELDILLAPELQTLAASDGLPRSWRPRSYQQKVWDYLDQGGLRACLIWHRRSGKDDIALNWAAKAAHRRIGEYWHMLPESSQARKAIWDAVSPHTGRRRINQAFPADLVEGRPHEQDMRIKFKNGSLWRVVGSDNYESLLGSTPAGIVYSEWAMADPNARAFLRPILAENKGWELFITTPRGANHALKTYEGFQSDPDAFAELLTADDTGIFTKEQLDRELHEYIHDYGEEEGKALFEQEYYCSFESALVGSYYGPYLNRAAKLGRVSSVPIERASLVYTSWDLGISDSTAIWFIQCVGKERRLVDYHENSGVGLEEYALVLQQKQTEHRWIYGRHYFPHDIAVRELGNKGMSRADTLKELGIKVTIVPQHNVNDGINAVRRMLDATWIDQTRCERGLDALRNYRRDWSEKLKMFRDAPVHDWASHGADALRTFAWGFLEPKEKQKAAAHVPEFRGRGDGTDWMGV